MKFTTPKAKIRRWSYFLMGDAYLEEFLSYLFGDCKIKISEIKDLYCNDTVSLIIESAPDGLRDVIKLFFSMLWAMSKCCTLEKLLSGLGFDLDLIRLLIKSGYDKLSKIKKVNYEQLIELGVSENEAKEFIEDMIYLSDEMEELFKTNRVSLNPLLK